MSADPLHRVDVTGWRLRQGLLADEVPPTLRGAAGLAAMNRGMKFMRAECPDPAEFEAVFWYRQLSTVTVVSALHTPLALDMGANLADSSDESVVVFTLNAATVTEDRSGQIRTHAAGDLIVFAAPCPYRMISPTVTEAVSLRISFADFGSARALLRASGGVVAMDSLLARTAARTIRGFGASVMADRTGSPTLPAELAVVDLLSAAVAESQAQRSSATGSSRFVQLETRELIERHYRDPDFSPAMIAERLHLSRRQFYRHFENSDRGVAELIADRRLQAARTLLIANPKASIASVARASGFGSLGPFRLRFRKAFGVGPNEFRDQMAADIA